MHSHSDADAYTQIAHTRVARKFWDAYLCTALYLVMYCKYPICQQTSQCNVVKQCEINCKSNVNYTYMSVSYLLWNLGNYLSITALCQQICLPSIISNATDHKNEIWKTVKLTSSYYLYSPSQSSVLDSLSTIKHSNFQIILAHQEAFCLTFCSTASEKGRFTREAID